MGDDCEWRIAKGVEVVMDYFRAKRLTSTPNQKRTKLYFRVYFYVDFFDNRREDTRFGAERDDSHNNYIPYTLYWLIL
jgi:hypothetical protein